MSDPMIPAPAGPDPDFSPPAAAACFYVGPVMHARMKPRAHRFSYSVFSLLIDLGRLDEADRLSPFFSVGRFNLIGFDLRPHGLSKGSPNPRGDVVAALRAAGMVEEPARVLLLCYPRVLGFVFNPLSVYFAYAADGRLIGVHYEVRNTFGERHAYVEPVLPGQLSEAGLRQEAEKLFYVSPFMEMRMRYHFRIRPPGEQDLALRILETDPEGPILAASFFGHKQAITAGSCLRLVFSIPLMTLKVVAGIHWEALRLWWKGVALVSRPAAPPPASHGGKILSVAPEATREAHHAG